MSLALVQVPLADFHDVLAHLVSHMPSHRNMHLRQVRQQNGRRVLRYLHAMHVAPGSSEIEGMISGPQMMWRYKMLVLNRVPQIQVLVQRSSQRDAARIQRRFLPEILARIAQEQSAPAHYARRLAGQFYLRRSIRGMHHSHRNCVAAVASGSLDPAFVAELQSWRLALLHP